MRVILESYTLTEAEKAERAAQQADQANRAPAWKALVECKRQKRAYTVYSRESGQRTFATIYP